MSERRKKPGKVEFLAMKPQQCIHLNFEVKNKTKQCIISLRLFKILLVQEARKSAPNQLKGNVIWQLWRTHIYNLDTHTQTLKREKNFPQTLKPRDSNFSPVTTSPFPCLVVFKTFMLMYTDLFIISSCFAFSSLLDWMRNKVRSWKSFLCELFTRKTPLIALRSLPLVSPNSLKVIIVQWYEE